MFEFALWLWKFSAKPLLGFCPPEPHPELDQPSHLVHNGGQYLHRSWPFCQVPAFTHNARVLEAEVAFFLFSLSFTPSEYLYLPLFMLFGSFSFPQSSSPDKWDFASSQITHLSWLWIPWEAMSTGQARRMIEWLATFIGEFLLQPDLGNESLQLSGISFVTCKMRKYNDIGVFQAGVPCP